MNQIIENILTRRSVRVFSEKDIAREDLEQILKAGLYAPSGMNRQTWQFTAIVNREKIQKLAKLIEVKLSRAGYNFYNPSVIVLVSNEKTSGWAKEDTACALENMFLAAHSLEIGSVWINQLKDICDEPEVRAYLNEVGVPEEHNVYGIAALGYAAKEPNQNVVKKGIVKIVE
ncbi:nitroreductase family protein [Cellulosilyticum ruminicola]|uniref:nitroreductase family protein n=1 Tax=Cellulosilyticum ruminicola TaxID=425254 RepID=UPI0006CF678B|nr:nitroreductase family protein [Cellulosilyticum ruminicola]